MAYLAILVYFSFSTIVSSIDSLYFLGDFWSVLIWIKIHIFAQIQIIMPGMVCHARLFTIYSCLVHKIFTFKSGRLFLILRNWGEVHVFHCRVCTRVCTVAYKKPPKPCGSRGLSGGRYRTWKRLLIFHNVLQNPVAVEISAFSASQHYIAEHGQTPVFT